MITRVAPVLLSLFGNFKVNRISKYCLSYPILSYPILSYSIQFLLVSKENRYLQSANVGDSTAFIQLFDHSIVPLSKDHKPTDAEERERIIASGSELSKFFIGDSILDWTMNVWGLFHFSLLDW